MLPKWHILFGAIFSLILYLFLNVSFQSSLTVFLASVLIDIDHYIYYISIKKNLSLKKAYFWFIKMDKKYHQLQKKKRKGYYYAFCILHGIEPVLIILSIGIITRFPFFFFLSLGFIFHLIFDFVSIIYEKEDPFVVSSLIYKKIYIHKRKNLADYIDDV